MIARASDDAVVEREIGHSPGELHQLGREFDPRERRADAEVDPAAEAQVGRVAAGDPEGGRVGVAPRIPVGRADHEAHALADIDRDPTRTTDPEPVLEHPAREVLEGRIPAQDLFERRAGTDLPGPERSPLIRMRREGGGPVRGGVDRCLMAGHQEDHDGGSDLVIGQVPAVAGGTEEAAQEVRRGPRAAIVDEVDDVADERGGGLVGTLLGVIGRRRLVHGHDGVGQVEDVRTVGDGYADQVADHAEGKWLGNIPNEVQRAMAPRVVEQGSCAGRDPRALCLDRARRECGKHQTPEQRVVRRFEGEHVPALEPLEIRVPRIPPDLRRAVESRPRSEVGAETTIPPCLVDIGVASDEMEAGGCRVPDRR